VYSAQVKTNSFTLHNFNNSNTTLNTLVPHFNSISIFYYNVKSLRNKKSDFWIDFNNFMPTIFCFSETMVTQDWKHANLQENYTVHSVRARKGNQGRPMGGFLFGWKRALDIVIIESNNNFIQLLIPNINLFIFLCSTQPPLLRGLVCAI